MDFNQIYEIMEDSFPPSEIRTRQGQKKLLSCPNYKIHLKQQNNVISGFIATWEFNQFCFVEHLAVRFKLRGSGIGRTIIQEYIANKNKIVILEVEPPNKEIAVRRIGFYKRLGFILNDFEYFQPPLREGQELLPLKIMSYPKSISLQQFDLYISLLKTSVYSII